MIIGARKHLAINSGLSMIELVVASAVSLMALKGTTALFLNHSKSLSALDDKLSRAELLMLVMEKANCRESLRQNACLGDETASLYSGRDEDTKMFVRSSNPPTRIGKWTLKANCDSQSRGFRIRAVRQKTTGTLMSTTQQDYYKHPLSRKIVTWADPESDLLPGDSRLCADAKDDIVASSFQRFRLWLGGNNAPLTAWPTRTSRYCGYGRIYQKVEDYSICWNSGQSKTDPIICSLDKDDSTGNWIMEMSGCRYKRLAWSALACHWTCIPRR